MSKRVTMQDIADRLSVSKVTVSKALRGSKDISEAMSKKIKKAALELGYTYNVAGKMLKDNKTYSIGILSPERYFGKDDYFYVEFYKLLSAFIEKHKYTAMFSILDNIDEKNLVLPRMLIERKVDGIIILGQLSKEYVSKAAQLNIPIIFADFYYDGLNVDSIITDNFFGAYEITNSLIYKGHKKIAFVGNINSTSSIQDRFLGYYKSILEYRLPIDKSWIINDKDDDNNWIDIAFPDNMPTAFVCNCDITAQKLIEQLKKCGYNVPGDFSVAGFDDTIHAVVSSPKISTVHVNLEEMARVAAEMIANKINDESVKYGRMLIKGNIIIRESTREINK